MLGMCIWGFKKILKNKQKPFCSVMKINVKLKTDDELLKTI